MNANPETQHKVLILGNQEVGKTAIVNSWARGVKPNRAYRPTVFNTIPKSVQFDGRSIQLEITDTGGLDEYSFFPKSYGDVEVSAYEAFVIVYAINKKDSLFVADSIKTKLEKQRGCKFIESHGKPTPLLLVANKTDLESERMISTAKGRELAKKWQLPDDAFLEVSATQPDQIKCLFNNIIRMLDEANREPEEQRRCSIM